MTDPGRPRIVVGLDFGPSSVAGARWVSRIFGDEAQLTLVYVVHVPHLPSFLRLSGPGHGEIVGVAQEEAENALAELAAELPGSGHEIEVRLGEPAGEIAAVAQEKGADMVIIGSHGQRSGLRSFLGSTAERLLRACPVPVLLVTSQAPEVPRRILVPVDESALARQVLEAARSLSRRLEAKVTVLHAVHPGVFRRMRMVSFAPAEESAEQKAVVQGRAWLEEEIEGAGFREGEAEVRVVVGDPAHEIIAAAARIGADLIVMGSWGSGTPGHFLLGGAVRVVLANAPSPVLVVTDTA